MIPDFDVSIDLLDRNRLEITLQDKALEPILSFLCLGLAAWVAGAKKRCMSPDNIAKAKDKVSGFLKDLVDKGIIYEYCDEWYIDDDLRRDSEDEWSALEVAIGGHRNDIVSWG